LISGSNRCPQPLL